jgi:excisionase family DNA binding protein
MQSAKESFLTPAQVCRRYKLTMQGLYGLVHRGSIPYSKCGRLLRFNEADLVAWVKARTHIPDFMDEAANG